MSQLAIAETWTMSNRPGHVRMIAGPHHGHCCCCCCPLDRPQYTGDPYLNAYLKDLMFFSHSLR